MVVSYPYYVTLFQHTPLLVLELTEYVLILFNSKYEQRNNIIR